MNRSPILISTLLGRRDPSLAFDKPTGVVFSTSPCVASGVPRTTEDRLLPNALSVTYRRRKAAATVPPEYIPEIVLSRRDEKTQRIVEEVLEDPKDADDLVAVVKKKAEQYGRQDLIPILEKRARLIFEASKVDLPSVERVLLKKKAKAEGAEGAGAGADVDEDLLQVIE